MPKILSLELDLEEVRDAQLEQLDEILQNQEGVPNTPIRVRVRSEAGYEVWELEVKATPTTPETLKLECPWLQPKLGINGDAVLAKYERAPKPWEKKAQGGEARVLN